MNDERAEEANAEHVGDDVAVGSERGRRDEHRLAELRSLALHGRIAARVALDPTLVDRARAALERQAASGLHVLYVRRWRALLAEPLDVLLRALVADDEGMRDLRQTTPFTFVIAPRERWAIWRSTKARFDRGEAA